MYNFMYNCFYADGQSCVDIVNAQQQGSHTLDDRRQVIVPMTAFSCNGSITGYLISLEFDSGESGNPTIQVFRPTSSSSYMAVHEYLLQENDITDMGTYHLANVSFTGNDRIEIQPGDIIGYYIPSTPQYNVWNIETEGYTSYLSIRFSPDSTVTISGTGTTNRQPLIQLIFGNVICDVMIRISCF